MPLNAVVDASILVSAFLFPGSVPGRVLKLAADGVFVMHLSPILIEETRRSLCSARLRKSYGHDDGDVLPWTNDLGGMGKVFSGSLPEIGAVCRDADDDHVIATAVAVGAEVIVTGDRDLLTLRQFRSIRMLTARAFLDEISPAVPGEF